MPPVFKNPFPIFAVRDLRRSIEFYQTALGFVSEFRWPADESAEPEFATMKLCEREIGLGRNTNEDAPAFTGVELCLEVDDIDAAWSWLLDHGATAIQEPTVQPWGESNAYVGDPDGLKIHIYCKR